jgi:hypothetical protein
MKMNTVECSRESLPVVVRESATNKRSVSEGIFSTKVSMLSDWALMVFLAFGIAKAGELLAVMGSRFVNF